MRLEILNIETRLLMRYIDDIRILLRKLRAGSMIKGNKIVIDVINVIRVYVINVMTFP